ncbi:MAG: EamA family transporter, partial [Chloroflexota bacterium]
MGIFWGLLAAFGYGTSDFIGRGVSVKLTSYRSLFYVHLVSALVLLVVTVFDGIPDTVTLSSIGLAVALGVANTV